MSEAFDPVAFLRLWVTQAELHASTATYTLNDNTVAKHRWLSENLPVAEALAHRYAGRSLADRFRDNGAGRSWDRTIQPALELVSTIEKRSLLDEIATGGGPALPAETLHEIVWGAAAAPWRAGLRRTAVGDAASALETLLKVKVGRGDETGKSLLAQSWSTQAPTPEQPRLRFPNVEKLGGDDARDLRWQSAHEGAMYFGMGCMQALRNWAAHTNEEPDEQNALEYLAALSVLARWIEDAEVDRAP